MATGVGIAPTPPGLQPSVQTNYTIQWNEKEAIELRLPTVAADDQQQMPLAWECLKHADFELIAQRCRHAQLKELAMAVASNIHSEIARTPSRHREQMRQLLLRRSLQARSKH